MRRPLLLLVASLLCGCPSASLLGTARTMDKGKTQWALELATTGTVFTRTPTSGQPFNIGPTAELGTRHGLTDRVELGGRLWGSGVQVDGKFALLRTPDERGLDLSLAPSAGVVVSPLGNQVPNIPLQLAVLGGWGFDVVYVTVGARLMDQIVFYQGPINTFWGGFNLGVALKLSDRIRLMPEVALMVPFRSNVNEVYFQSGLGVLFGP